MGIMGEIKVARWNFLPLNQLQKPWTKIVLVVNVGSLEKSKDGGRIGFIEYQTYQIEIWNIFKPLKQ